MSSPRCRNGIKAVTLGGLLPELINHSAAGSTFVRCFWLSQHKNGVYPRLTGSRASGNGGGGDLKSQCVAPQADS